MQRYFQQRETAYLNRNIIQNQEALYEGRYTVKDEVNRNIGKYLSKSLKYALGIRTRILVKTADDRILYPAQPKSGSADSTKDSDFSEIPLDSLNYLEVAAENYRILNEGLDVSVDVQIKHNSWISNTFLVLYVFVAVLILQRFAKKMIREAEKEEIEQKRLSERLSEQLNQAEGRLKKIEAKEQKYLESISELKKDKNDLSRDIDGLLEEMEKIEAGLRKQKHAKEETELEVIELREELDRLRGKLQKPKQKKGIEVAGKRFRVLYKNLVFTDRAIEGFLSLPDKFQLKAEEIVHKLNEDNSMITAKRKVFGKGGKMNVLEVDFSYSGRIYFQRDSQSGTTILAIGTKNTQERDLAFIESVRWTHVRDS
jgi:DNA repair exonuclease SbcCD ATPase subunit